MRAADQQLVLQQLLARQLLAADLLQSLQEKAQKQGQDIFKILVDDRYVGEETLAQIQAGVVGVEYVSLIDKEIPSAVLNALPAEKVRNFQAVPFERTAGELHVAMLDPHDYEAVEAIDFISHQKGLHVKYYLTSPASIQAVLRQYENLGKEVARALQAQEGRDFDPDAELLASSEEKVESAPVSKIVSVILRYAVEGNASDVHIEPSDDDSRVRYRVDGVLHTSLKIPKAVHDSVVARIKVLANLKLDETRLPQDGRFHRDIDGHAVDFRVSTMPLLDSEKVALRILDKNIGIRTLEQLGFTDHNFKIMAQNLKQPHGMLLMTGPTGSGKSTTLYSLLQSLNQEDRNIVTLEDPVEYNIPGVSQSQIRPEINLTFARGLRFILRQDPDIIMVGEIRDNETAELAIHAALTGHMVLSTLHTNNAIGTLARLVDMKVEPFLIASAVKMMMAQRLIRRLCPECRQEVALPPAVAEEMQAELQHIPSISVPADININPPYKVFQAVGCRHCNNEGYHGRLAMAEVIAMTDQLERLIAADEFRNVDAVRAELQRQGMITMKQDGLIKALRGLTTVEEIIATCEE